MSYVANNSIINLQVGIRLFAILCYFLLAQKVTKKGPENEYSPFSASSLIKR